MVVGTSLSGQDISMELVEVAKAVSLSARSLNNISEGLSKVISKHDNLHLHPQVLQFIAVLVVILKGIELLKYVNPNSFSHIFVLILYDPINFYHF